MDYNKFNLHYAHYIILTTQKKPDLRDNFLICQQKKKNWSKKMKFILFF